MPSGSVVDQTENRGRDVEQARLRNAALPCSDRREQRQVVDFIFSPSLATHRADQEGRWRLSRFPGNRSTCGHGMRRSVGKTSCRQFTLFGVFRSVPRFSVDCTTFLKKAAAGVAEKRWPTNQAICLPARQTSALGIWFERTTPALFANAFAGLQTSTCSRRV